MMVWEALCAAKQRTQLRFRRLRAADGEEVLREKLRVNLQHACSPAMEDLEDLEVGDVELGDSTVESHHSNYIYFSGADGAPKSKEHPDKVSETASMHAVGLPRPTYAIALPRELLENGSIKPIRKKNYIFGQCGQKDPCG
jgi:hypothetical protein